MTRTTESTRNASVRVPVAGFPFPVLASAGLEESARPLAERCARAYQLLADALGWKPQVTVQVLSELDWRPPLPYGMPHFASGTLVLAGEEAEYWRSFVPLINQAPPSARALAVEVYGPTLDLGPFFDLLAVHEMGHAFHAPVRLPRRWLEEAFANLGLHSYVAAAEPARLPTLRALPAVVTSLAPETFAHRTLAEFEELYSSMHPLNYGWYQCHLHRMAERVYDIGGIRALERLHTFEAPPEVPDAALADRLRAHVGVETATILLRWPTA